MPTYNYKARDVYGRLIKGIMAAESEIDLSIRLKKLGFFLTQAKSTIYQARGRELNIGAGRLNRTEILDFTTQMAICLDAGVNLLTSLKDLAKNAPNRKSQMIIEDIARKVESGTSLKEALNSHPASFSQLYVSLVGSGESTGKLALVTNDLAKLLEWQMDLRSKIKEATLYPIILASVMVLVVTLLVMVVIPKFEPMFKDLDVTLPLPTRIILGISAFSRHYGWLIFLAIGLLIGMWFFIDSNEKGSYYLDRFKTRLPLVGELVNKIALSRFCRTFALAIRSGVNVFDALGLASLVTGNKYIEKSISKARDYVNVGEKISSSLDMSGKFPGLVIRRINVGEQTGNLALTLEQVTQFYDREVPAAIKRMFTLFEPAMIVFMGVVVGGIALSVFLPLLQLIGKIGD